MTTPLSEQLDDRVLQAVELQIEDLEPDGTFIASLAETLAALEQFEDTLARFPAEPGLQPRLASDVRPPLQLVMEGKAAKAALGQALTALLIIRNSLASTVDGWITTGKASTTDRDILLDSAGVLVKKVIKLLARRPDVAAVLDDLAAMKDLRGGPADAVAYHDFHVLQLAFKDVWVHAFDASLKKAAEDLYTTLVADKVELGAALPDPLPECEDVAQLRELVTGLQSLTADQIPPEVWAAFGTLATQAWSRLNPDQQYAVIECAKTYGGPGVLHPPTLNFGGQTTDPPWLEAKKTGEGILNGALTTAQSARGRLADLLQGISRMLAEPYAFDVFAKDSYNFGIMLTYRQRWDPGPYQAGDLVATIPLAPGETRKFSRKQTVRRSRAVKEIEKSMSSRSTQSSETSRAEYEIMQRTTTATNFKMTASGSFNVGIGSITTTSEFGGNQEATSAATKRGLHEATLKAAEEYRLERSLEVDTSTSSEVDESASGEISNPNNEITVTYLFYELQRRYRIREFLYRVRPVILVAQEVPSPDEIDEAWLLKHAWILSRVILDDSLKIPLGYLSSGFAGDELAVNVKKAHWEAQRRLAESLEAKVKDQLAMRDKLREALVTTTLTKDLVPHMPGALKFFTFGVDPSETASDALEANRKAIETRLAYAEGALADAQDKAKDAASSFESATKDYSAALEQQYNRRVAIDQLRIHVKQNILYYMQAIWDQEPVDQRFFRLYKVKVACIGPDPNCVVDVSSSQPSGAASAAVMASMVYGAAQPARVVQAGALTHVVDVDKICSPVGGVGGDEHELVEIADIDNPLGYKGNYIIFPLKHSCHISDYMLTDFIDNYLGLLDPDGSDDFVAEDFEARWIAAEGDAGERDRLRQELVDYLTIARRTTDEIIVPTAQLFIEALPGSHPLLEEFKLAHRAQDVRKVMAEVRHMELENLRLAARLGASQDEPSLLEDPDIEKKIVVAGPTGLTLDTDT